MYVRMMLRQKVLLSITELTNRVKSFANINDTITPLLIIASHLPLPCTKCYSLLSKSYKL